MVQLSSMSSQCGPTGGICRKWSITQMLVKPASSAATASSDSRSRVSAGPPGKVNRGICRPNSRGIGASCWRAAAAGAATRSGATTTTSPGGWTAANPSSASASRTSGHRASIEAITLAGIGPRPGPVAGPARGGVGVEHDGHARDAGVGRGPQPAAAALGVGAERVDDRGQSAAAAGARPRGRARRTRPSMPAGRARRCPTTARRPSDDTTWCGRELRGRPRRLPRRRRPHQHHERALGEADAHHRPACPIVTTTGDGRRR